MGNFARQVREASQIPRQAAADLGTARTHSLSEGDVRGAVAAAMMLHITQRTAASSIGQGTISTPDATPVTLGLTVPGEGAASRVDAVVVAKHNDLSAVATFEINAIARKTAGTATLETTTVTAIPAATTLAADVVLASDLMVIEVTGLAATDITWEVFAQIREV